VSDAPVPPNPVPAPRGPALDALVARYPRRAAAMLPVLSRLQAERGHLSDATAAEVAGYLGVPEAHVQGVISFYSMYDRQPIGRHKLYVCRTLSCRLRGAEEVIASLENSLGVARGGTSADGKVTLVPFECLGLCEQAPAALCGERRWGNLTPETAARIPGELP
jgi:NADH-quinone oxidoreductase subunit E